MSKKNKKKINGLYPDITPKINFFRFIDESRIVKLKEDYSWYLMKGDEQIHTSEISNREQNIS